MTLKSSGFERFSFRCGSDVIFLCTCFDNVRFLKIKLVSLFILPLPRWCTWDPAEDQLTLPILRPLAEEGKKSKYLPCAFKTASSAQTHCGIVFFCFGTGEAAA